MWQQGVISEDDYRNAAAQPLVLAEEDSSKKSSSTTSYFTDALFNEVVKDIMAKEGVDESTAQSMLYTGGYTIEATVNPKLQTAMENLMLNTDDAYFPAGWHEEEVTSISDDDVQVYNEDGTPKTRTGEDGTVYYYRNVRTQAAMVTLDYDGNVLAMVGGLGEKTKSLSLNRAYGVTRQTGSTIKPIGAYALGIEYGLVNWSTMLNNSPLYLKQDMVIRDEDYCRRNGLMGLTDKQLKAYPNAWRSWPRNYGGNYGDNSDLPLWNGLARSLNTIAIRWATSWAQATSSTSSTIPCSSIRWTRSTTWALRRWSWAARPTASPRWRWRRRSRSSMTASTPRPISTPASSTATATFIWKATTPAIRP